MDVSYCRRILVALVLVLASASTVHAVKFCTYSVTSAYGFCPVHAGATVCVTANALTGTCSGGLACSGTFCQLALTPAAGPFSVCPLKSVRVHGAFTCRPVAVPTHPAKPTVTARPTATATRVPPTPTATVGTACQLGAGRYTITQTAGGTLRLATFAPFPVPAGGVLVQDVSAGDAKCVHTTVVPFPGGYVVHPFCVPALNATIAIEQAGCGVGRIDSNGGADYTITEDADTSETPRCNVPQTTCPSSGPTADTSGRVDITVGNGVMDTCTGGGAGNAAVTVPVVTTAWVSLNSSCPDSDGTYDAPGDTLLARFPQTLDLTTDTNTARFADLDMDGCARIGLGPSGPRSDTGSCIDFTTGSVAMAGAGAVFSSGNPLFDILFTTKQPGILSAPAPSGGSVCNTAPPIDFGGLLTRCVH